MLTLLTTISLIAAVLVYSTLVTGASPMYERIMRRRIVWLTIWMTLVCWLGHGPGCTSSTRVEVDSDAEPIAVASTEDEGTIEGDAISESNEVVEPDVDTAEVHDETASAEYPITIPYNETEPSLIGMNRFDWPRSVVRPADGRTWHDAIYFRDSRIGIVARPVDHTMTESEKLKAALDGAKAANWSSDNLAGGFANPPKFGLDLLALPFSFVATPGWQKQSTP